MAAQVALSQALGYARDLKAAHEAALAKEQELTRAHERLWRAYEQSLRYARDLKRTHRHLQEAIFQSLLGLANAIEAKDPGTHGHGARVARLAERLALAAGVGPAVAQTIGRAGLLHDLGKIAVPEGVLRKPGPLTAAEWELMRRHPIAGAQIVAPLEFFAEGAVVVRHHHERQDGSGYPDGLRGEDIPLGARIVAIADVFDALASDRPYRLRLSRGAVVQYLREQAGRTLDARLTTLFIRQIEEEPRAGMRADGPEQGSLVHDSPQSPV